MRAKDICVGAVLWPRPSDLTKAQGCIFQCGIPPTLHPYVCLERDDTHGLWLMLTSQPVAPDGGKRRPISTSWKVGAKAWAKRRSYVSDVSIIVPHDTMERASELNDNGYWISHEATDQLLREHELRGGLTLLNSDMAMPTAGQNLAGIRDEIVRFAACRGVTVKCLELSWGAG